MLMVIGNLQTKPSGRNKEVKSLIFDTETTGFPSSSLPHSDPSQPYVVQLAALLTTQSMILQRFKTIIQCPIESSEGAFKVHGISKEKSMDEGIPLRTALAAFNDLTLSANRLVAHNMKFDLHMMEIAYAREGILSPFFEITKVCTMRTVTPIMRGLGKRWTLDSSYRHFVDPEGFEGAHDAEADTMACFKLLLALEEKDIEVVTL